MVLALVGLMTTVRRSARRALLLGLLREHDVQPPILAVPMTDEPDVAMTWYRQLQEHGWFCLLAVSLQGHLFVSRASGGLNGAAPVADVG
jgi:hypothetical protein